jgi:NTP pyrophosphatase (non-canonical NTP hydrolase)
MSYAHYELEVLRWAEQRRIIPNSTPQAQAIKTQEELDELIDALRDNDQEGIKDAYGDILVTLIIGADLAGLNMVSCLAHAYEQIKDRKGTLGSDGIFYKE